MWIHLQKERFLQGHFRTLELRVDGPFRVMQRISENAYKIKLPEDYGVLVTFNIADLSPYEEEESDLRTSPFQLGENDRDF